MNAGNWPGEDVRPLKLPLVVPAQMTDHETNDLQDKDTPRAERFELPTF